MMEIKIKDLTVEYDEYSIHIYKDGPVTPDTVQRVTRSLRIEPNRQTPSFEEVCIKANTLLEAIREMKLAVVPGEIISTGDVVSLLCIVDDSDPNKKIITPIGNLCPVSEAFLFYKSDFVNGLMDQSQQNAH